MSSTVGTKGQVVIEKKIRDQLGIQPGYKAVQYLEGDLLILRFIEPEHNQSLRGSAKSLIQPDTSPQTEWDEAVGQALQQDWLDSTSPQKRGLKRNHSARNK